MAFEAEIENEEQAAAPLSIRDELEAALSAAPAVETPAAGAASAAAQEGRARDDAGKFAKADKAAAPVSTEPKPPEAGAEPQSAAITPPASWSAAAKADFASLPPLIQQEVKRREDEVNSGLAQWQSKGERLNRLDAVLGPRQDRFRLSGMDEAQAVGALLAAQDLLETKPVAALQYLAKQYGVDLRSIAPGAPQQPQAQLHPAVQQMAEKIQSLEQTLAQQQSTAHQAAASETQGQIAAFAADPSNIYFENVRPQMAALIKAGQATDLKDAYEKATWAHPEIRPLLLKQQDSAAKAASEQAARAKANEARRASGSVIGSPTPGSSPASAGPALSLRAELERQFSSGV